MQILWFSSRQFQASISSSLISEIIDSIWQRGKWRWGAPGPQLQRTQQMRIGTEERTKFPVEFSPWTPALSPQLWATGEPQETLRVRLSYLLPLRISEYTHETLEVMTYVPPYLTNMACGHIPGVHIIIIAHFIIIPVWSFAEITCTKKSLCLPKKQTHTIKHQRHNNFPVGTSDLF